jgi:uncharacterized caspase-like protein
VLTFFIAGLLYLLRFKRVDNLGAYSIPSETGLLIPSVYDNNRVRVSSARPVRTNNRRTSRLHLKSTDAKLAVFGADALARKGTAYVLVIGLNRYANSDFNLQYAVADAQDVGDELRKQLETLNVFSSVEVVSLTDQDATKANILLAFERLSDESTGVLSPEVPSAIGKIRVAQPEDAVFIYFAGHGSARGQRFYLVPHDLGYGGRRDGLSDTSLGTIQAHSISDVEMQKAFETIDAGELVLLIDACYSGQALEATESRRGPMNSEGLAQLAYEKGMYVMAAAQGYQPALESNEFGHGFLTYALVEEGLKQGRAAESDGEVYLRQWLDYASREVPQLVSKWLDKAKSSRDLTFASEDVLQRPRVFYRREEEAKPFLVGRTILRNQQ